MSHSEPDLFSLSSLKQSPFIFVFICLVMATASTEFFMDVLWKARYLGWGDFRVYYAAAHGIEANEDIYDLEALNRVWVKSGAPDLNPEVFHVFPYPPLFATLLRPLAVFPITTAARIWMVINTFLWIMCVYLVFKFLDVNATSPLFWILSFFALRFEPALATLSYGQVNLLVFIFVMGALIGLKHRRPALSGFCLAFAIMLKLTPLVILGYLIFRKHYQIALWSIFFGILILIFSCVIVDISTHQKYFLSVLPNLSRGFPSPFNQSILGWLLRLSHALQWPVFSHWVYSISRMISIVLVIITFRNIWNRSYPPMGYSPEEISLCILLACVGSPVTWTHHLVWMIIPFSVACCKFPLNLNHPFLCVGFFATCAVVGILDDYYAHPIFLSGPLVLISSIKLYGLLFLYFIFLKTKNDITPQPQFIPKSV